MKNINEEGGFANMPPDQFKRYLDSLNSDEARKKAEKAYKKSKSATPRPKGSGPQLPKVPKPKTITRLDIDNPAVMRNVKANPQNYTNAKGVTPDFQKVSNWKPKPTPAVKGLKKPSILKSVLNVAKKNKKLAIPLALAGGAYALMKGKKKSVSEEMMTTGPNGFSNAADPKGPRAGYDPLMFAKPQKRKIGPWIKSAIAQGKKRKKNETV